MTNPTLDLAIQLLARASVTPQDEHCQDLIKTRLAPLGFSFETIISDGVTNLWARHGTRQPVLAFAGHTDVVPTGPLAQWHSPPFTPTLRDGYLYARGAADMKSSIAAFIVAVERFLQQHPEPNGSIAFLITSDEEGPATDGTIKVVEALRQRGEHIDYCIVGEPSSSHQLGDVVKNGRRGSLSGELIVHGIQGHIAYPHLAKNPIHLVGPLISELAQTTWDEGNLYFPATAFQISNIQAGTGATNVIPGELSLQFNFRHSTESNRAQLAERFEHIVKKHITRYSLQWTGYGAPFLTPLSHMVDAITIAIKEVTGLDTELSTSGGTSDGRFIASICSQIVECGPVNATIHKINECVRVDDLDPLARIYQKTLELLLT